MALRWQDRSPWPIVILMLASCVVYSLCHEESAWQGPGEFPEPMPIEDDDEEMNAAMQQARNTVDTFVAALSGSHQGQSLFSVKIPITDGEHGEYVWLDGVEFKDGRFHGDVGNDPEAVYTVSYGDEVSVAKDEIADWMFVEDGKLVGGFTMRVMRSRLSSQQRAKFDRGTTFMIE